MNALRQEQKPLPARNPTPSERRARKPGWKHAEDYFRRERDRKLPVTLPRVRCLEEPDGE